MSGTTGERMIDKRYQLARELGRGAFGAVYKAFQMAYGTSFRTVALKLFLNDMCNVFTAREMLNDALVLTRILQDCPDPETAALFLQVYDVGSFEEAGEEGRDPATRGYMAMELMSTDLRQVVGTPGKPNFRVCTKDEALAYLLPVARALAYMHSQTPAILHRDLKPENVLLKRGHGLQVKVGDFGLAVPVHSFLGSAQARGTVRYMDLESLTLNTASTESDVFAVGLMLYELLTGRFPFRGKYLQIASQDDFSHQVMVRQAELDLARPVIPPRQLNPELKAHPWLEQAILDCLTTHRLDRVKDGRELLERLTRPEAGTRTRTVRQMYQGLVEKGDRLTAMGPEHWQEAGKCYGEAMKVSSLYCLAPVRAGELLAKQGQWQEAMEMLMARNRLMPCPCVRRGISSLHFQRGEHDLAQFYESEAKAVAPCKFSFAAGGEK